MTSIVQQIMDAREERNHEIKDVRAEWLRRWRESPATAHTAWKELEGLLRQRAVGQGNWPHTWRPRWEARGLNGQLPTPHAERGVPLAPVRLTNAVRPHDFLD